MLEKIFTNAREKNPLVHCITNYVTVNQVANIILATGGSPIMADDLNEAAEITALAQALVINIGTLNARTIESMIASGKAANAKGIPVILDPVGCGASAFRQSTVTRILEEVSFSIIKGNISEMKWISQASSAGRGVDAAPEDEELTSQAGYRIAADIATKYDCIAAISGKVDIICGKDPFGQLSAYFIHNGNENMKKITGVGCMLSGMLGVFAGANPEELLLSALGATAMMGTAGDFAQSNSLGRKNGTGSFAIALMDWIGTMKYKELSEQMRITKKIELQRALKLYAITPEQMEDEDYFAKIEQALQGGITMLQLREKHISDEDYITLAIQVKRLCQRYDVPLIINDNPYVAKASGADGVHIGQEDMEIRNARKILGDKIIGVSAHNLQEAQLAQELGADYVGIGAVFPTASKDDTTPMSLEQMESICKGIQIPAVAIGGIKQDNLYLLKGKGLAGVSVISAIFSSKNITSTTRNLLDKIQL